MRVRERNRHRDSEIVSTKKGVKNRGRKRLSVREKAKQRQRETERGKVGEARERGNKLREKLKRRKSVMIKVRKTGEREAERVEGERRKRKGEIERQKRTGESQGGVRERRKKEAIN